MKRLWFTGHRPALWCDCCGSKEHDSTAHRDLREAQRVVTQKLDRLRAAMFDKGITRVELRERIGEIQRWHEVTRKLANEERKA